MVIATHTLKIITFKYDKTTTIRDLVTSLTLDLFKGIEITNFEQFK